MQEDILKKLKLLKKSLISEGFIIDGIFGSYARGDFSNDSDVDILYHLDDTFYKNNMGFMGFKRINEIKHMLSEYIEKKVDFAPKNNLSKTAKKYILKDVIYV